MHKKLKLFTRNLQQLFDSKVFGKMALKHQFVKRNSKLNGENFYNLCTFHSEDLCSSSLTKLCAKLAAKENVILSPQALDKRFTKETVQFMKDSFNEMMKIQNKKLMQEGGIL